MGKKKKKNTPIQPDTHDELPYFSPEEFVAAVEAEKEYLFYSNLKKPKVRQQVLKRTNGWDPYRATPVKEDDLAIDHVVPVAHTLELMKRDPHLFMDWQDANASTPKGKRSDEQKALRKILNPVENLVPTSREVNRVKGDQPPEDFIRKQLRCDEGGCFTEFFGRPAEEVLQEITIPNEMSSMERNKFRTTRLDIEREHPDFQTTIDVDKYMQLFAEKAKEKPYGPDVANAYNKNDRQTVTEDVNLPAVASNHRGKQLPLL